jgi:hypothetical protein
MDTNVDTATRVTAPAVSSCSCCAGGSAWLQLTGILFRRNERGSVVQILFIAHSSIACAICPDPRWFNEARNCFYARSYVRKYTHSSVVP